MNDFQKKTIETAAAKVQSTKAALASARESVRSNNSLQNSYREQLRALENRGMDLGSAVEQAGRDASEAKNHYDYVCKDFAGIPSSDSKNFVVHLGGQIRDAFSRV